MHALRRHRSCFARLVAMVLLLAALAPAVSRGLAFVEGRIAPWTQVCSTEAGNEIGAHLAGGSTASHLLQHCALCVPGGDAPAWPALAATPTVFEPPLREAMPPLWLQAPAPLHVWAATRSRAPPLAA